MSREQATKDQHPLELRIMKVYDTLQIAYATEGSHVIEVEVLSGDDRRVGKHLTLPYDEWMVGKPPPKAGEVVKASPADWVRQARSSTGKPMRGWGK